MSEIIKNILNLNLIRYYGICSFNLIRDKLIKCKNINLLPINPVSIICAVFPYYIPVGDHNISRYAIPMDYHKLIYRLLKDSCKKLCLSFPNYDFVPFTDNSPIPEVYTAIMSGLGVQGDNNLLITPEFGSWVFIGEIVTDMYIQPNNSKYKGCIHCSKCKTACPSGCLSSREFLKLDCISYITQKKQPLSDREKSILIQGKSVWGCDICQECCPMSQGAEITYLDIFKQNLFPVIKIGDYNTIKDRAFQWRPKSVIERNITISEKT